MSNRPPLATERVTIGDSSPTPLLRPWFADSSKCGLMAPDPGSWLACSKITASRRRRARRLGPNKQFRPSSATGPISERSATAVTMLMVRAISTARPIRRSSRLTCGGEPKSHPRRDRLQAEVSRVNFCLQGSCAAAVCGYSLAATTTSRGHRILSLQRPSQRWHAQELGALELTRSKAPPRCFSGTTLTTSLPSAGPRPRRPTRHSPNGLHKHKLNTSR